jgi:hypothetical protein
VSEIGAGNPAVSFVGILFSSHSIFHHRDRPQVRTDRRTATYGGGAIYMTMMQ